MAARWRVAAADRGKSRSNGGGVGVRRRLGRAGGNRHRTLPPETDEPNALSSPATTLVTSGPYALTRNPMYVSLALLTTAFALFLNTWWIVFLLIPVLLVVQRFVIVKEERYLRRRFGAEYEAYTRRVRRWL